jgi:uncharacterized RDD family membrane protein YckC
MNQQNPYAPPAAPSPPPAPESLDASGLVPAERGTRFGGALIDGLIGVMVMLPIQYAGGLFDGFPNMKITPASQVMWGAIGFVIWFLLHGYFLRNGQTIGKRVLGMQVVNVSDGRPASLVKMVFVRYLPVTVMAQVPVIGGLLAMVDALLIFGQERRCLHDLIAGTRVVRTPTKL